MHGDHADDGAPRHRRNEGFDHFGAYPQKIAKQGFGLFNEVGYHLGYTGATCR